MLSALAKLFQFGQARELARLRAVARSVLSGSEALRHLSDSELRAKTDAFKALLRERVNRAEASGADVEDARAEALDEIMVEAFAVVVEACRRLVGHRFTVAGQDLVWQMVPYEVQIMGAVALHRGNVAEMATGEGKTLVAAMPAYLNALAGQGVHIVTVNSYLASRDAEWMGPLYDRLGISVGVLDETQPRSAERRSAYAKDVTFGTNKEFGFDYLRDGLVGGRDEQVQRPHQFAIVDEVDSVLIDEARTPMIISGPSGRNAGDQLRSFEPRVRALCDEQVRLVTERVSRALALLDGDEDARYQASEHLLLATRGLPKHRQLRKLLAERPELAEAIATVEADRMRSRTLADLDEGLLFTLDEKRTAVHLSDRGLALLSPDDPDAFVVPDLVTEVAALHEDEALTAEDRLARTADLEALAAERADQVGAVHNLIRAFTLYQRDVEYVVEQGDVVIVDEFTGRKLPGRRWQDGLHEAIEAKEGLAVRDEMDTLAAISLQNYLRLYEKLAGMTGTAVDERAEFEMVYGMSVVSVPTNKPVIRDDREDLVYRTRAEKLAALIREIGRLHVMDLPVLVGTSSVEASETLSRMLRRAGIEHNVLNAQHHQREAEIVARAGSPRAVTIATNMAGRGTDIRLERDVLEARTVAWAKSKGLDPRSLLPVDPALAEAIDLSREDSVLEVGGLHVLGSERHASRRIDRQLVGRSGRQGDPGASQFFLSMEDDLLRLFGEKGRALAEMAGDTDGIVRHPLVSRFVRKAQRAVENRDSTTRRDLLKYDNVLDGQRRAFMALRDRTLDGGAELHALLLEMGRTVASSEIETFFPTALPDDTWDLSGFKARAASEYAVDVQITRDQLSQMVREDLIDSFSTTLATAVRHKIESFQPDTDLLLRAIALAPMDRIWRDHLRLIGMLQTTIIFSGFGQEDPVVTFGQQAHQHFTDSYEEIQGAVVGTILRAQVTRHAKGDRS